MTTERTTHCAWCGLVFPVIDLLPSPNGTNLWCKLCLAVEAFVEDHLPRKDWIGGAK